jgi:hypothetical protein
VNTRRTETGFLTDLDRIDGNLIHTCLYAEVEHAQRLRDCAYRLEGRLYDGIRFGLRVRRGEIEYREQMAEVWAERCAKVYDWYRAECQKLGMSILTATFFTDEPTEVPFVTERRVEA